MSASFAFLVNPSSGGGAAPGAVVPIARSLREAGARVEVTYSPGPQATVELVAAAVEAGDVVVSVGGDGMLSSLAGEVARRNGVLGIVPAGRGNDFVRMLGLPDDPDAVARHLLSAEPRPTDLLAVTLPDDSRRVVAGSVYGGVDAQVAAMVNRTRWLPKKLQYPVSAVRGLAGFKASAYTVTVDDTEHRFDAATVVVANSAYYGSGMVIAPPASVDDGALDVVVIEAAGRIDMIRSFPKVYDGRHVDLDQVHLFRGSRVRVTATPEVSLGGDGEPLGQLGPDGVEVDVLPGAVSILR